MQVGGTAGQPWSPVLIDDETPWVDGYRGLFGLDTFDRFAGERAPAGPKYGRNGTVRQVWNDPIGWSGLTKVAPPFRAPAALEPRLTELEAELAALQAENDAAATSLDGLELEVRALAPTRLCRPPRGPRRRARQSRGGGQRRSAAGGLLADSIRAGRPSSTGSSGDFGDPRATSTTITTPYRPR